MGDLISNLDFIAHIVGQSRGGPASLIVFVCVRLYVHLMRLHFEVLHPKPLVAGQAHMLLPRVRHSETLKAHWLISGGPVNGRRSLLTLMEKQKKANKQNVFVNWLACTLSSLGSVQDGGPHGVNSCVT